MAQKKKRQTYGDGALYQECSARRGCPPLEQVGINEAGPIMARPKHACKGLWRASIEAGWNANGTRRRVTVSSVDYDTARRKLRDKRREIELHGVTEVSARDTVKTWAEKWLPIQEKVLAPNAYTANRTAVTKWIIPTIGHKRFDALNPGDVRAVAAAIQGAGRKSSTARRTHSVLRSLLEDALVEGYPVKPALLAMDAPALSVSDRTDMAVEEAVAVLEVASHRLPHASRWVAALLQGMRQGECLGLTWANVDLDAATLVLAWQAQHLRYKHGCPDATGDKGTCGKRAASCPQRAFRVPDGYEAVQMKGTRHLVRPKSKSGWRVIPLVPWMVSTLTAWREVCPDSPHGLVWPNPDGTPKDYKADDAEWYELQAAADVRHPSGRPYTGHETRHTTATLLLEAGVDPAVITAIMGHSSIVTSRGYMHAGHGPKRAALDKVAAALSLPPGDG